MEEIVAYLSDVNVMWIYITVLVAAWLENIFPPSPSDVVIVVAGSLVSLGEGSVVLTLLCATVGSTAGFITMYWVGRSFDHRVIESGKLKFISRDLVHKVQGWFARFGYWVVIANRFLSGTRAVISFGAGLSEMHFGITVLLSALSALLWNSILIYLGYALGGNWEVIGEYLSTYSTVVTIIISSGIIIWALVAWMKWRRNKKVSADGGAAA
jgi:membrane protein DedA with SNARE-associated domain